MIIAAVHGILSGLGGAIVITRGISLPIRTIAIIADEVAIGDINQIIELGSRDETGKPADSFRNLVSYMAELAGAAQQIARNDLTVSISQKSDQDALGNAFRTMVNNLTEMITAILEKAGSPLEDAIMPSHDIIDNLVKLKGEIRSLV